MFVSFSSIFSKLHSPPRIILHVNLFTVAFIIFAYIWKRFHYLYLLEESCRILPSLVNWNVPNPWVFPMLCDILHHVLNFSHGWITFPVGFLFIKRVHGCNLYPYGNHWISMCLKCGLQENHITDCWNFRIINLVSAYSIFLILGRIIQQFIVAGTKHALISVLAV